MKDTWFYRILRPLKFFRKKELQLEPLKIEPEKRNSVLGKVSLIRLREMEAQLKNRPKFLEEWKKTGANAGNPVLFLGLHGSGQVQSAGLLGKFLGKEVYRVDLSPVTSGYIGETEKNLSKIFTQAAGKDWILFFDEADALFGKRTNVKDSHDRYANLENYFRQRIKEHPGPVIIAAGNLTMDREIQNRFRLILKFPLQQNDEEDSG